MKETSENEMRDQELEEKAYLDQYDITLFDRPSLTVDILLLTVDDIQVSNIRKLAEKSLKILLIKRNEHPYINKWAIPGGFVKMTEGLDEAAQRELYEETGVDHAYLEQLYTFGALDRDPRGRIVSSAYMSLVDSHQIKTQAGSDASDAKWFDIEYDMIERKTSDEGDVYTETQSICITLSHNDIRLTVVVEVEKQVTNKYARYKRKLISSEGLAFDHGVIIQLGIERLRNKMATTDIAFQLMPDYFTLSELQKTYEVILGTSLSKANFRRKTAKYVKETDKFSDKKGYRPSKLFRYKPDYKT